ncbi:MAG TPA: sigma-70 family RNA polymerase sigma factor [Kofleriaceae bacterium]
MSEDLDFALLARWRSGDRSAGEELFTRQFDHLYRFFASKCDADTDELVQATLVACLHAKQQFRAESTFRAYMFTVARHELYRHLRERRRDVERLDFSITSIADLATTPGTRIARDQAHRQLLDALRKLPVEQQTLLELYYWEDLDVATLGTIFEAPPTTIRTWLYRARQQLKERLAAEESRLDDTLRNARIGQPAS